MSKTVTGILIDPFARTVTPVQVPDGSTDALLHFLYANIQCDIVGSSGLPNEDSGYYDDDGLLKPWDQQAFFYVPGWFDYPLAGRWIVTRFTPGVEEDYDPLSDCATDIDKLRATIQWVAPQDVVVPSPQFVEYDKAGNVSSAKPVDGGSGVWTFDNQPT